MPKNSKNSHSGATLEAHPALRAQFTTPCEAGQLYEDHDSTDASGYRPVAQVKALLTRVESALVAAERRAEKAEQRIETLEEFIRNELVPRITTPPPAGPPPPPSPPSSPPPSVAPGQIPGVGLDLSRVVIPEITGAVRRRVNKALKERGITCLGVNSKGNGRYRLLFQGKDIDNVRKDDTWVRTHFDKGTLYGEQWYPMRVDRAYHEVAMDEMGCSIFGQLNGVKVHKMRWLGNVSVDSVYFQDIRHQHAPRRLLSVHRVVEKVPTKLLTPGVQYIDESSPSYDHHHCILAGI
ncbi:hypothetical protein ACEPPN_000729 [Leptodophora sp. 'Broadleaf-Isolate-01']